MDPGAQSRREQIEQSENRCGTGNRQRIEIERSAEQKHRQQAFGKLIEQGSLTATRTIESALGEGRHEVSSQREHPEQRARHEAHRQHGTCRAARQDAACKSAPRLVGSEERPAVAEYPATVDRPRPAIAEQHREQHGRRVRDDEQNQCIEVYERKGSHDRRCMIAALHARASRTR
ncbi:MAG: hypothetical protein DIU56_005620 [Pseudomonadota bacterium]